MARRPLKAYVTGTKRKGPILLPAPYLTRTTAPRLIDHAARSRAIARARTSGFEDFLLRHAAADLLDRLSTVKRDFVSIADVGTPAATLATLLAALPACGKLVRAGPLGTEHDPDPVRSVASEIEALPLATGAFDLIVSGLALHLSDDLPGTLIQIRRALKPDGLFLACLAGGETLTELRQSFAAAETELLGGVFPHVLPFADLRDVGALLQRAGFALPVADTDKLTVRYPDMVALMRDLRAMGATNVLIERSRRPMRRAVLIRAAEHYARRFADADGRLRATFELVWLSGWAPHESQQTPLRPGSAAVSLTKVLKPSGRT